MWAISGRGMLMIGDRRRHVAIYEGTYSSSRSVLFGSAFPFSFFFYLRELSAGYIQYGRRASNQVNSSGFFCIFVGFM